MGSRRHLTIGITVNLDNYENLRLEMSGEVEEEKDTEELIVSLDTLLARLGRGTPETAERVDSYRRRVFTLPKETPPPEKAAELTPPAGLAIPVPPLSTQAPASPSLPLPFTSPVPPAIIPTMAKPSPAAVQVPEKSPAPVTIPAKPAATSPLPAKSPSPPPVPPAPRTEVTIPPPPPAPRTEVRSPPPTKTPATPPPPLSTVKSPGELTCEQCGAPITSVQRKLSRLFQNKDLCKKCLNQP